MAARWAESVTVVLTRRWWFDESITGIVYRSGTPRQYGVGMPTTTGDDNEAQFDEDDRHIARFRQICLDFPDAREELTWGRPNFRVGSRIFALAGDGRSTDVSVWFKPDADERRALLQQNAVFEPAYLGPKGWLGLDLPRDLDEVDWQLVAELCETSYRLIALRRQVARLDARRG